MTEADDRLIGRIHDIAQIALVAHPQRERARQMLDAGAWMFVRPAVAAAAGRFQLVVGWFADPRLRPADADPDEVVVLVPLMPRAAVLRWSEAQES